MQLLLVASERDKLGEIPISKSFCKHVQLRHNAQAIFLERVVKGMCGKSCFKVKEKLLFKVSPHSFRFVHSQYSIFLFIDIIIIYIYINFTF